MTDFVFFGTKLLKSRETAKGNHENFHAVPVIPDFVARCRWVYQGACGVEDEESFQHREGREHRGAQREYNYRGERWQERPNLDYSYRFAVSSKTKENKKKQL